MWLEETKLSRPCKHIPKQTVLSVEDSRQRAGRKELTWHFKAVEYTIAEKGSSEWIIFPELGKSVEHNPVSLVIMVKDDKVVKAFKRQTPADTSSFSQSLQRIHFQTGVRCQANRDWKIFCNGTFPQAQMWYKSLVSLDCHKSSCFSPFFPHTDGCSVSLMEVIDYISNLSVRLVPTKNVQSAAEYENVEQCNDMMMMTMMIMWWTVEEKILGLCTYAAYSHQFIYRTL